MNILQTLMLGDKIRQLYLDDLDWKDSENHHFIISAEIMALETILDNLQIHNVSVTDYLEMYNA